MKRNHRVLAARQHRAKVAEIIKKRNPVLIGDIPSDTGNGQNRIFKLNTWLRKEKHECLTRNRIGKSRMTKYQLFELAQDW